MPYVENAELHDADSHIMETPEWMFDYVTADVREKMQPVFVASTQPGEDTFIEQLRVEHRDPGYRARDETEIMLRKNWKATGSFIREDRPRALDLLGFRSQLVFNTFTNPQLLAAEHGDDVPFAYALAEAHNRGMADFCSVDPRLFATGYVPLRDFDRALEVAVQAIDLGCKALLIPSACPAGHSPSHVDLDPLWAVAQEARLPIVLHVGNVVGVGDFSG